LLGALPLLAGLLLLDRWGWGGWTGWPESRWAGGV
jgi:hypothetical protein